MKNQLNQQLRKEKKSEKQMDISNQCKKHKKEICFLRFNQEGQYSYECIVCDVRNENNILPYKLLLEEISENKNNSIIYNWPPLDEKIIYEKIQNFLESDNNTTALIEKQIDEIRQKVNEYFDLFKKKIVNRLISKEQVKNTYNITSQRNEFSKLLQNLSENNTDITNFLKTHFQKMNENTKQLQNIVKECERNEEFGLKELTKLQENIKQQLENILNFKEIEVNEELLQKLKEKQEQIINLQNLLKDQKQNKQQQTQIFINMENCQQIPIEVSNQDTIKAVKNRFEQLIKSSQPDYKITNNGIVLDEQKTLNQLNIQKNTNLLYQRQVLQQLNNSAPKIVNYIYKNSTVY